MEKIVTLALTESLYKSITYLRGEKITTLADSAKRGRKSIHTLLSAARGRRFRLSVKKAFGKLELTTHERSGSRSGLPASAVKLGIFCPYLGGQFRRAFADLRERIELLIGPAGIDHHARVIEL